MKLLKNEKIIRTYNINVKDKLVLTNQRIIVTKKPFSKKYDLTKLSISYKDNIVYLNNDSYKFNNRFDLLSFKGNFNKDKIGSVIIASVIAGLFIYTKVSDSYHLYKKVRGKIEEQRNII